MKGLATEDDWAAVAVGGIDHGALDGAGTRAGLERRSCCERAGEGRQDGEKNGQ
jgi:hypothetical protein